MTKVALYQDKDNDLANLSEKKKNNVKNNTDVFCFSWYLLFITVFFQSLGIQIWPWLTIIQYIKEAHSVRAVPKEHIFEHIFGHK